MPHKNRKYKKKMSATTENKCATSSGQLQPKEIEQVAAILKSSDLSEVPLIVSLAILQKRDAIAKLLKKGCKIDEFGPDYKTALMWSVQNKNFEITELLLKNGADCSLEDQNGNCVLFQTLEDPAWEETTFLNLWELVKDAKTLDIDRTNKNGTTLLYLAVKREWTQAVIVLVGKKANVNVANYSGATPLMLAGFRYNESLVEILLQTGADVFKRDEGGRTALCYAISTAIDKCLQPPFNLIDLLLSEMETKGYCLIDYLKHVVECSLTETLAHVVMFTVTHIPNGVKLLLEANSFNATLKVFHNQPKDLNEQKTLLMVVAEVLSHDSTSEANKNFFATDLPQTCIEILQSQSINDAETFLKGETIHLLILACGDTEEGANFLKNNIVVILKNYDRCFESFLLQRYESDDPANQTVQYKIKMFQEQLQRIKNESELFQSDSNEQQVIDDNDTTLVAAIKDGVQQLQKNLDMEDCKSNMKCKQFDLNELQRLKQQSNTESVDCIISYLEEVLQKIVMFYQSFWKFDGDLQKTQEESLQIQRLQDRFKSLANTIKESFPLNPTTAQLILDQLETVLLQHNVRGKTVVEMLTSTEYLPTSEETGDQLYLKEMLSLSKRKETDLELQKAAQAKTMEHKYHLIPSIMAICDDEDFEVQPDAKTILKSSIGDMSRWRRSLERLNSVRNWVQFLGGDIRMCSREKGGNYIIPTSGNFTPVEIGLDMNSRPLAIKRIPKASGICRTLKMLVKPLLGLRNTHILHYFACDFEENELILATPLCEYNIGEYITYMRQNTPIPLLSLNGVVCQFLSGLKFLHEFNEPIVHGNLKPSNVFIDLHGVVKIAEFGIHRVLFQINEAPTSSTIWFARETYETFKNIATIECSLPSDIHVSGMLVHFILTDGKHAYGDGTGEILTNLEKGNPQLISTCDMDSQDLITWMLLYDPKDRPTISQVLSHVFFWSPEKRWSFILTCSGIGPNAMNLNVEALHTTINSTARKDDIKASWVLVVKQAFPKLSCIDDDNDNTPTGLLRFIKSCYDNRILIDIDFSDLSGYILRAFPSLTLSLYRMLGSTSWLIHPAFLPFIN